MLLKPSGRNLLFSLFLIGSARLPAQTQLTCDATSLATAISAVLTGGNAIGSGQAQSWGWQFPQATIDTFTGCTDFVTCLPTITPLVNSFKTKTFGAYGSSATDWTTVCPECIVAIALALTITIYFKQPYSPVLNSLYQGFPLAELSTHLNNILAHSTANKTDCDALFVNPPSCPAAVALGQLFQNITAIATAKTQAVSRNNICQRADLKAQYDTQANGLQDCVNTYWSTIVGTAAPNCTTTANCASDESCFINPATGHGYCLANALSGEVRSDIANLNLFLNNAQTAITGMADCCITTSEICSSALGANYSLASSQLSTELQPLLGYQAFSFNLTPPELPTCY